MTPEAASRNLRVIRRSRSAEALTDVRFWTFELYGNPRQEQAATCSIQPQDFEAATTSSTQQYHVTSSPSTYSATQETRTEDHVEIITSTESGAQTDGVSTGIAAIPEVVWAIVVQARTASTTARSSPAKGTRFVLYAQLPRQWTQIKPLPRLCVELVWWRGCGHQCPSRHNALKTMCSVLLLEVGEAVLPVNVVLFPKRHLREIYVVPADLDAPDTPAFWSWCASRDEQPGSQPQVVETKTPEQEQQVAATVVPRTYVPLFDDILATAEFEPRGSPSKTMFSYFQMPKRTGILSYLRQRQRDFASMLMWRSCSSDCSPGGRYPHSDESSCYLLFLELKQPVVAEAYMASVFHEWFRARYILAIFEVGTVSPQLAMFRDGLFLERRRDGQIVQTKAPRTPAASVIVHNGADVS